MEPTLKIALVGAGMFGGDVHLRTYADLQRFGIAGQLARVGLDKWTRDFAAVKFELVAVATRSEASTRRSTARHISRNRSRSPRARSNGSSRAIPSATSEHTGAT